MFSRYVFAVVLALGLSSTAWGQSQFGRYVGVLKHSQLEQDQLAKLDFVVSRQNGAELKLVAILSLYFGDFESREYVTYHFDSVTYNVLSGNLVFDQPDQEVTLVTDQFSAGRMVARIRSVTAGDVGTLELVQGESFTPARSLIQPLWGEYRGVCDGVGTILQVQTSRSSGDSSRMGNPFGTYDTTAQMAEVNSASCGDTTACVWSVYGSGSYDFFSGRLDLSGRSRDLSCKVGAEGLDCNGCSLKRTSAEAARGGIKVVPRKAGGFDDVPQAGGDDPAAPEPATTLGGTYRGYLFHERLGIYQAVSMNIVTYQRTGSAGSPALFVSASSSLHFGGFGSPESVTHRYNEREFPLLAPQIVLDQMGGDVDAVVQLTKLGNGVAKGIWYSLLYGRVGTFELSNVDVPELPQGATVMSAVAGRYQGGLWRLDLKTVREATPVNTVNPFYPMTLRGTMRLDDITPNIKIVGGSFDYYTGKLSIVLENESLFTGFRPDNDTLSLKRPTPGVARPLLPHATQPFARVAL